LTIRRRLRGSGGAPAPHWRKLYEIKCKTDPLSRSFLEFTIHSPDVSSTLAKQGFQLHEARAWFDFNFACCIRNTVLDIVIFTSEVSPKGMGARGGNHAQF
jgi:hypothetical protein